MLLRWNKMASHKRFQLYISIWLKLCSHGAIKWRAMRHITICHYRVSYDVSDDYAPIRQSPPPIKIMFQANYYWGTEYQTPISIFDATSATFKKDISDGQYSRRQYLWLRGWILMSWWDARFTTMKIPLALLPGHANTQRTPICQQDYWCSDNDLIDW